MRVHFNWTEFQSRPPEWVSPPFVTFLLRDASSQVAVLGRSRPLIDCLVSCNYADCTADNYKSVNTLSKNRRFFSPLQMRRAGAVLLTF